ncbi:MAG: hypothetical protein ACT4PU_13125 [Planctomycetota bacterium]
MRLTDVSLQFLVQTGFGSMLTFVVNDRKALGPKYFKFGGWVLLGLYGLAATLVWEQGFVVGATTSQQASSWSVLATAAGLLAFSAACGWGRAWLETLLLWVALLAGAVAVAAAALSAPLPAHPTTTQQALRVSAAFGSALTLGFTTWGMILGHWYLVSQGLSVSHLARIVKPLPWLLGARLLLSVLALWWLWPLVLNPAGSGSVASLGDVMAVAPERVLDLVNLFGRIPVGLALPALLAVMTLVTVRMERTQPATGILYAMCVLVYLGELMGKMFEGGTGVPL